MAVLRRFASIAFFLPALAAADASAPGDNAKSEVGKWHITPKIDGRFDRMPSNDRNMINAPTSIGLERPLDVSDDKLKILNSARERIGNTVLYELGLRGASPGSRTVEAAICFGACTNGLGGHYGGLDVTARFKGVKPDADADSFGFATVALVAGDKEQFEALHAAILKAARSALDSFRVTLGLPVRTIALHLADAGFSDAQWKEAPGLLACAAGLAPTVALKVQASIHGPVDATADYRIGRYHPGESEASFAADLAAQIEGQLRDGFMAHCRLPPAFVAYHARAVVDPSPSTKQTSIIIIMERLP
jgi:hypothetical protein